MKTLRAGLNLVRFQNLIFIALTQILIFYKVVRPEIIRVSDGIYISSGKLTCLVLSTVLIAAAGYMINDYFDIRIDRINKPHKVLLDSVFPRKYVVIAHIALNLLALALVVWMAKETKWRYLLVQLASIILLVIYSTSFKRRLFVGNLLIACLTALSIITIGVYENHFPVFSLAEMYHKLFWLYILFAFLLTLIREIIKDMEDVKGDLIEKSNTLPIRFGINTSKKIVNLLLLLLVLVVFVVTIQLWPVKKVLGIYLLLLIVSLGMVVFYKLKTARVSRDFHELSTLVKFFTIAGVLSMFLIHFN